MVYRPIFFGSASGNMEETSTSRVTMGHKKDGRHGHCARSRLDVLDVDPAARGIYGIYMEYIYNTYSNIYGIYGFTLLGNLLHSYWKTAIELVDLPNSMVIFNSYVKLPVGMLKRYEDMIGGQNHP